EPLSPERPEQYSPGYPRPAVQRTVRRAAVQPGPRAGGVLDLDRGAGVGAAWNPTVRHRPRSAADHRGAQGTPSRAAGPGGGRVRLAAPVSAGASWRDPIGSDPASVVDTAPAAASVEISRGPPDVRGGPRHPRSGLDPA